MPGWGGSSFGTPEHPTLKQGYRALCDVGMWVWAYDARWRFVTRSPDPIDSDELVPNAFMFDGGEQAGRLVVGEQQLPAG